MPTSISTVNCVSDAIARVGGTYVEYIMRRRYVPTYLVFTGGSLRLLYEADMAGIAWKDTVITRLFRTIPNAATARILVSNMY